MAAYNGGMVCPICRQRKAKRACPAKGEMICSLCCGREREATIACPFDCVYLRDSREMDGRRAEPGDLAYRDVRIEDRFLEEHEALIAALARVVLVGAFETPGTVDSDVREALDAMIKTQRTLDGGIHYETRPASSFARGVTDAIKSGLDELRREEAAELGFPRTTDADVLKTLVFLLRLAQGRDNGRPRGRAFLHLLARQFDMEDGARLEPAGGLILPGR